MKPEAIQSDSYFSNVLLTGTLLLANAGVNGLIDYSVKAVIGGAIWLAYKIVADFIEHKSKNKHNGQH